MSTKIEKPKKWYAGVTGLYIFLITVSFLAWLRLGVDTLRLFPAYIYPYPYIARGLGHVSFIPIIVFQIVVFASYLSSLFVDKGKYRYINLIAGICAVLWFIIVSVIMLVSILN